MSYPTYGEAPNLIDLADRILNANAVRDAQGYMNNHALPSTDENVRIDDFLRAIGLESVIVTFEGDAPESIADEFEDSGSCRNWEPTRPSGDDWQLIEIFDHEEGPVAVFAKPLPNEQFPRRGYGPIYDLESHLIRQRKFSQKAFGYGKRTEGIIDHIKKELVEIEQAPNDVEEWIDVVMLGLDGAWRSGAEPVRVVAALKAKLEKNEQREWPDWRTADQSKAIEHVRGES